MDAAAFRTAWPAFASDTAYPDTLVTAWLAIGARFVSEDRWGDSTDFGIGLFVAHNLTLEARSAKATAVGGAAGGGTGVLTGKTVDKVSATYDSTTATMEGAGNWNATDYGVRYWQYARMFGAGGLQL